jgi:hypothetical protein
LAEKLPIEQFWPILRVIADTLVHTPLIREDHLAQAGARFIYYLSCPATRRSFVSAAREMALDPAFGAEGFWTRLEKLEIPTAFIWGERDRIVSFAVSQEVARAVPDAPQLLLGCLAHALNGPHHRCLVEAVGFLIESDLQPDMAAAREARPSAQAAEDGGPDRSPCAVEALTADANADEGWLDGFWKAATRWGPSLDR